MILDFVPSPWKPRPLQAELLPKIEAAFERKRFVVLEAPPGVGKTLLAVTLAQRYGSTWVCTVTKQLQSQYVELFEDIGARELMGRGAFDCERASDTCDVGGEKFRKEPCSMLVCPYRIAKAEALKSDLAICNYHSYLYGVGKGSFAVQAGIATFTDPEEDEAQWHRKLLVCDEAHLAEDVLLDIVSVTVDASRLPIKLIDIPFPDPTNAGACFAWLQLFADAGAQVSLEEIDRMTPKARKEFNQLMDKAQRAIKHIGDEWIAQPLDDPEKQGFQLKPLTVHTYGDLLFKYGERVLLMSATILDAQKLTESLGITDYEYICAPCPFPLENRAIVVSQLNMTKAHRDSSWKQMVVQVKFIMDAHANEKGLILTPSNEMLDYLLNSLPAEQRNRLIPARGRDRMIDYRRHCDSRQPTVLAAPGFWEGADLKDELSRFQILPAIPRPWFGGQTAARAQLDPVWYRMKTYQQLIQGLGRSVRSETDYCASYVLDGDLAREARRSDSLLPQWFKDALVFA